MSKSMDKIKIGTRHFNNSKHLSKIKILDHKVKTNDTKGDN